tara:strand:- start:811 stop:1047 length:237 start_codon:yes stop_codon:yes gene_type:complete
MHEIIRISSLSEAKIANHFGISRTFVHQWCCGERPIPAKYKKELYIILKDNLNEILKECKDGLRRLEREKESVASKSK